MKRYLILLLLLVPNCAGENFYAEMKHNWNERNSFYQSQRKHYASKQFRDDWDAFSWIESQTLLLSSFITSANLETNRPNQWREIVRKKDDVQECLEMLDNHPWPPSYQDEKKIERMAKLIRGTLIASDKATDALKDCERDDLEEAKDSAIAARAIYYR